MCLFWGLEELCYWWRDSVIYDDYTVLNTTRDYKTLEDKAALPLRLKQNQGTNSSYCYE